MKEFEIWIEGFAVTGNSAPASYIGKAEGETFNDACANFRYPHDIISDWDGKIIIRKDSPLSIDVNSDGTPRLTHEGYFSSWACSYYPTEEQARKAFG